MAFEGIVGEIPLGQDGLTGNKNLTQVSLGSLLIADNITFANGTIQKEGGAAKYNSTAITGTPSVIAGHDWFPDLSTQRMIVVTSAGTVLRDTGSGAFGTTLKSGLTVSNEAPFFTEGGAENASANRKLFLYTKQNQVQVLSGDGVTMSAITNPSPDWSGSNYPICGLIHENRHWVFSRHRAYYSLTTDHEDFTTAGAGSINVFPGFGEQIRAALSFKGVIVIWKYPKGIYIIDTSDSDTSKWRCTKHSEKIGAAGPHCGVPIDDDVLFLDSVGNFQLISTITEFGNLGGRNVSRQQKFDVRLRENYSINRLWNARGAYYVTASEVHFACASTNSSVNDRRIIVDLNRPDMIRFREATRDTLESLWIRKDSNNVERLVGGDNAGFVWLLDQTTKSKDGSGYSSQFQIPHIDFSHIDPTLAFTKKVGAFLELIIEPKGSWDLSVDTYWDGEYYETLNFSMGSTGVVLGTFVLGTDSLTGESVQPVKQILNGEGRFFSMLGRITGADQDFSIGKIYAYVTKGAN